MNFMLDFLFLLVLGRELEQKISAKKYFISIHFSLLQKILFNLKLILPSMF